MGTAGEILAVHTLEIAVGNLLLGKFAAFPFPLEVEAFQAVAAAAVALVASEELEDVHHQALVALLV